jgi:hypothetical protein
MTYSWKGNTEMPIKCGLIEIGNDNRAVIVVNEGKPNSAVIATGRVDSVDYKRGVFKVGQKVYDFSVA